MSSIVRGGRDFERRAVVQSRVRPVVVVDHVGADHFPGLLEGLELVAPNAAFFELAQPGPDEGLALGVAVTAAAMRDPEADQDLLERTGGERRAVVDSERQPAGCDRALGGGAVPAAEYDI